MTSVSSKVDRVGDQRESDLLSSIEDQHYDLIDERGDHGLSNKLNAQDVTKELIARESGRGIAQLDSQSATQSSLSTITSTGDNYDDDSKMKSSESSDSEMIVIDEGNRMYLKHLSQAYAKETNIL